MGGRKQRLKKEGRKGLLGATSKLNPAPQLQQRKKKGWQGEELGGIQVNPFSLPNSLGITKARGVGTGVGGGQHLWGPRFTYLTGQEKL